MAVFGWDHCRRVRVRPFESLSGHCTVDIYLVLLHELAELSEPRGSVDLLHVEQTSDGRGVECSLGVERLADGDRSCRRRVSAQGVEAREQHQMSLAGCGRRDLRIELRAACACPATAPKSGRACLARLALTGSPRYPTSTAALRQPPNPSHHRLALADSDPALSQCWPALLR